VVRGIWRGLGSEARSAYITMSPLSSTVDINVYTDHSDSSDVRNTDIERYCLLRRRCLQP